MATPNYKINYDDKRFTEVEADKKAALNEVDVTYGNMISNSDKYYQQQIDASKQWEAQQKKIQQEQTDFAIEQINQQKAQAQQDYTKEQSGAYVDWQKQSNQYGANAEQMAAQGMQNTGYSESSQVSMFNTYQNRVATARESYNRIVMDFNNQITEARLQNNAALAEIAYEAQKQRLELSLAGFQYKNQLITTKLDTKREVDNTYYGRYQDVLKQINTENALAEEVRQYNASLAEEKRQYNASLAQKQAELAEEKRQFNATMAQKSARISGGSSGGGSSGGKSSKGSGGSSSSSSSNINKGSGGSSSNNKKTDKNKSVTVDMQSVLNLGFGPISASRLNELVKSGVVEEYKSGNKLKYRKSASTLKQSMLFK